MTTAKILKLYRRYWPKNRRTQSTAIIHSGSRQTIFDCVCGSRHTTSTDWNGRNARHVQEWRKQHSGCLRKLVLDRVGGKV